MNTRASIIIIEDEKNICNFIETVLTPQNYQVTCAYTGTDGLKLINTHKPDVVLLDLGLPDMDGLEIIQEVRTYSSVPIIVISGSYVFRAVMFRKVSLSFQSVSWKNVLAVSLETFFSPSSTPSYDARMA